MKIVLWLLTIIILATGIALTQVSFFVVQPLGGLPDGVTMVIKRTENLQFIDSPDAVCRRSKKFVGAMCRGSVIGSVITNADEVARLPYSGFLYSIANDEKAYIEL